MHSPSQSPLVRHHHHHHNHHHSHHLITITTSGPTLVSHHRHHHHHTMPQISQVNHHQLSAYQDRTTSARHHYHHHHYCFITNITIIHIIDLQLMLFLVGRICSEGAPEATGSRLGATTHQNWDRKQVIDGTLWKTAFYDVHATFAETTWSGYFSVKHGIHQSHQAQRYSLKVSTVMVDVE